MRTWPTTLGIIGFGPLTGVTALVAAGPACSARDADRDGATVEIDCDDHDPDVRPGAPERCNGVDDDCDGLIDAADPDLDPDLVATWYPDVDGDGFGDDAQATVTCAPPDGLVDRGGDCDDRDDGVSPGAPERCDGADDDCDGVADDGAACLPQEVVPGVQPWSLAIDIDEGAVYFVDRGLSVDTVKAVYRVQRDGSGLQPLSEGTASGSLALDESHVYFTISNGLARVPRAGGADEPLIVLDPDNVPELLGETCASYEIPTLRSVGVEDGTVWFTVDYGVFCHPLVSMRADGTGVRAYPVSPTTPGEVFGVGLAVRDGEAWLTRPLSVHRRDAPYVDIVDAGHGEGIAIHDEVVVVKQHDALRIVSRDGGNLEELDSWPTCGGHWPWNVQIQDDRVYYLEGCSGEIRSVPLAGGEVEVHATGVVGTAIAVEPGWVWWGQIDGFASGLRRVRIPRPL